MIEGGLRRLCFDRSQPGQMLPVSHFQWSDLQVAVHF
jgi:hypothetical protein